MSPDSKSGAATPHSLYKLYKSQGAVMANPCTLRQQFGGLPTHAAGGRAQQSLAASAGAPPHARASALPSSPVTFDMHSLVTRQPAPRVEAGGARRRSDSPPRMQFKVLQARGADPGRGCSSVTLSLASLNMNRPS